MVNLEGDGEEGAAGGNEEPNLEGDIEEEVVNLEGYDESMGVLLRRLETLPPFIPNRKP